ncbi:MAG: GumC family protein [Acidobacteriota bacterium]
MKHHALPDELSGESNSLHLAHFAPTGYLQPTFVERPPDDKAHFQAFVSSLRKSRWLIIAITVLCTAVVAVYMAIQPDVYEAYAQVQVDLENSNAGLTTTKGGTFAVNSINDPAYFNTQLQVLTSPRLLRQVVKDLGLEHDSNFRVAPVTQVQALSSRSALPETPAATDSNIDAANDEVPKEDLAEAARLAPYVQAIKAVLRVEPVKEVRLPIKETRLIDVSVSHSNPQMAAKVVNAVVDRFVVTNLKRKANLNKVAVDALQQRIIELQTQIKAKENELLEYAKNHQILTLDATQNTVVERLVNLNRQLLEAENARKVAEAAYQAAQAPGAADALAVAGAREANEIENRLSQLRQRRAQLMIDFTPAWPEVKEIDNQIASLERQSRQMRSQASNVVLTNLGTQHRQAVARERALRSAYDQQRGETLAQNEAAVNYRILQQEIETSRSLLEGVLQRSKENEAALATMRNNIHVTDHAVVPTAPVGPRRLLVTGVAFALALGLGVGLSVIREYLRDAVRPAEYQDSSLQLRPLEPRPSITGKRPAGAAPETAPKPNGNGPVPPPILSAAPPVPFFKSHRQLRMAITIAARRGELRSLLVTSGMPGEGKTTVALNTATTLAQTGALVLIIDADLRKPCLHKLFNLNNETGLTTILSKEMSEIEALKLVRQPGETGVDVLTSGPFLPGSADLLGSYRMRSLIKAFQARYDYVIIDSPPVAFFTEGVLLSALVDKVLLVVDDAKSTRTTVRQSHQLLEEQGARILGFIANEVKEPGNNLKRYPASVTDLRSSVSTV